MKRILSSLIGLSLLLASCGQPQPPASEFNEVDLRKDTTRDVPAEVAVDQTFKGTIAGQDRDFDYYAFDADADARLQINVMSSSVKGSTLDPYVKLYMVSDDGWTLLEKDDDNVYTPGETGLDSEIRFNAPVKGRYVIEVTSFKLVNDPEATDNNPMNFYTLKVSKR